MINVVCGIRSTGRICTDLATDLEMQGYEVKIAYGREEVPRQFQKYAVRIGSDFTVKMNGLQARILDNEGLSAKVSTKRFLDWASYYNPDFLWLHNIHGYYVNYELLFQWIKNRPNMKVNWTLHDCWPFTGHCTHFTIANCYKWKKECRNCIQKKEYPKSIFWDRSKKNFFKKKAAFLGVKNMTLITPSQWLADLVKASFLREYTVEIQYNKVNSSVFKPLKSNFRGTYGIENKIMILGVASVWNTRKGLDDFIKLRELLDDRFTIVLVGLNSKQISKLPHGIIGLNKTNDMTELAAIYTTADFFINPSREETFGMTTIEAISCGTYAIVYKNTACEEVVIKYKNGIAVEPDVGHIYEEILNHVDMEPM